MKFICIHYSDLKVPNVQRAGLVNFGELATYDSVKHKLIQTGHFSEGFICHLVSSICSGFVSSFISTPADCIKSRMMSSGHSYTSTFNCLQTTVQREGFRALWKGWLIAFARLAPFQSVFWVVYEQTRRYAGVIPF